MKSVVKFACIALISYLMLCPNLWAENKESVCVDAYSSASDTKTMLKGAAFDAVAKILQAGSSHLSTAAEAKAPGFKAKDGIIANVMCTNPNGSVGISTISEWAYNDGGEMDTFTMQLTQGQNALNLAEIDRRGTLYIPDMTVGDKDGRYSIHFKVVEVDELKYSDEAFDAGKFNRYYSGKPKKKSQFTLTCQVLAIEEVSTSVKLGTKMP